MRTRTGVHGLKKHASFTESGLVAGRNVNVFSRQPEPRGLGGEASTLVKARVTGGGPAGAPRGRAPQGPVVCPPGGGSPRESQPLKLPATETLSTTPMGWRKRKV